uniref:Protein tyrosine phosphatase type IVA 3 n=1 Tax=Sus scrofa TaxID=9823 RepID=A0A480GWI8_PIG
MAPRRFCRMNWMASSYFIPLSMRASATRTGAHDSDAVLLQRGLVVGHLADTHHRGGPVFLQILDEGAEGGVGGVVRDEEAHVLVLHLHGRRPVHPRHGCAPAEGAAGPPAPRAQAAADPCACPRAETLSKKPAPHAPHKYCANTWGGDGAGEVRMFRKQKERNGPQEGKRASPSARLPELGNDKGAREKMTTTQKTQPRKLSKGQGDGGRRGRGCGQRCAVAGDTLSASVDGSPAALAQRPQTPSEQRKKELELNQRGGPGVAGRRRLWRGAAVTLPHRGTASPGGGQGAQAAEPAPGRAAGAMGGRGQW